jgi:hypothetical protein
MAEPIRNDDQVTTADIAAKRGNFASRPDLEAEALNQKPGEPQLVQHDLADPNFRSEAFTASPETRGSSEWDVSRTIADAANPNPLAVDTTTPLFKETEIADLRARWGNVQAGFVDEPRRSVEQADQLVATVMQRIAEGFANERSSLEKEWDSGNNISTEDLRVALQRYRAFFGRLLNAA